MNRRTLFAASALALMGNTANAQDAPDLLLLYLEILSTQDWSAIDSIMAEDYAPLYPLASTLPGREAWKQRQAASSLQMLLSSVRYDLVTWAEAGDQLFFLAEMHGTRQGSSGFGSPEIVVPLIGMLVIKDSVITAAHGAFDEALFAEQLQV